MCATIERWGRGLVALIALSACTLGREPAYDAVLAGEVTSLTAETLRLFQDFAPGVTDTHADREPQYRALAARAKPFGLWPRRVVRQCPPAA